MKRLMTGILLVGGLLAGCSNGSTSEPQDDSIKETEQSNKNENNETGKDEQDSKADSTDVADSLQTADSATLFTKDQFTFITPHSKWTEASLLELNSALDFTGREFMVRAECDSCDFLFKNLKLQSPYVLLKVENKTSNTVHEMSFIDLSRTDTAYVNLLTLFESKRILKLMKDGFPADSAERKAQQEVLSDLLGETFDIKLSNQISGNEKDSLTQNIKKAFSIGNIYYHAGLESLFEETGKWEKDSLKLIFADYAVRFFGRANDEEGLKPEQKIGSRIYSLIYGFGICDSKNIDSVKINADSSSEYFKETFLCSEKYGWHIPSIYFSNTYGWGPGYDGEIRPGNVDDFFTYAYDSIQGKWISPSIQNGIACVTSNLGKVIKTSDSLVGLYSVPYRICEDLGYQLFWNSANKEQYYSQGIECDSAYTRRPSLIDSTVQVLCYEGKYTVIMPTEPDEPKDETLLDKEAKLIPCGEDEESFHKGQIDTTIYYYCYKGDLAVANEFDMIMGHGCHAEHKGYYSYQNSIYNCNGFSWRYASDSLVTGSVEDERDGTVYGTIGIGDQIWLSENMNLAIDSSWCPEDSLANCTNFGRLYRWDVILGENAQVDNICPTGFRVPTNEELEKLEKFGKTWFKNKMDTQIFKTKNFTPGEDLLGFSLYLAGGRSLKGSYNGWRSSTNLCSQDHSDADSTAYVYRLSGENSGNFVLTRQKAYLSCSVRCIKD